MTPTSKRSAAKSQVCELKTQSDVLRHFATYSGSTQSQRHIKPLHWYVACRLVLEGGFRPDELEPRPPFMVSERHSRYFLSFDQSVATAREATVLGGLKTKNVDVVINKEGIGPVLAVSCKGMTGALRNLVNRMEETIGECTNLHITYPALVFGYLFVIRAHEAREDFTSGGVATSEIRDRQIALNDIVLSKSGEPVESVRRFHAALCELAGRRGIRNDVSRYEAVSLALVRVLGRSAGEVDKDFPPSNSPLRLEGFFQTLYRCYDERYVFSAPSLKPRTRRLEWSPDSPAFEKGLPRSLGYEVRLAD